MDKTADLTKIKSIVSSKLENTISVVNQNVSQYLKSIL